MAKITFADILSGYATASSLNTNFNDIESEFQNKVLYRDNPAGEPNQMLNDLDMNSNDILNAGQISATSLSLTEGLDGADTFKVKVSGDDTTENYLISKLTAGSNITIAETDGGTDESITISATGTGATTLNELTDVDAAAPTDGEALVYNNSTSNWEASTVSATVTALNDVGDVDAASPSDNDVLTYNTSTGNWEPDAPAGADTYKVKVSSNDTTEDFLESKLVGGTNVTLTTNNDGSNETITIDATGSGGATTLDELNDVSITAPHDGAVLGYNNSAGVWEEVPNTESFVVACSDETSDLTTGTGKATFRMPYAFTVTGVRASVTTAPSGSTIQVDINESGTSILSTVISIDAGEKTSTTAATAPVISDAALADDAEMTIDIDQVGSSTAGAGLKVTIIGYKV